MYSRVSEKLSLIIDIFWPILFYDFEQISGKNVEQWNVLDRVIQWTNRWGNDNVVHYGLAVLVSMVALSSCLYPSKSTAFHVQKS